MTLLQRSKLRAARLKLKRIRPYLSREQKIVDIGSGNCALVKLLLKEGYHVVPCDISNKSRFPDISPVIANGDVLPFQDNEFDVALLITMLHHTPTPENIVLEASRVADQLIIIEDIYTNVIQKYLTFFVDSLVNWEFKGHPHSNKTDVRWNKLFNKLKLTVVRKKTYKFLLFFKQVLYDLRK